jgi:hypothetical protein
MCMIAMAAMSRVHGTGGNQTGSVGSRWNRSGSHPKTVLVI